MRISLILYPSINSFQYRAVEKYHCFSCQVHQKRYDVIILYDNVACIQIMQHVYSRHRHNFFILHSFWICVYTLFFKNIQRKSFQITLIENTGRQFYLVMQSVLWVLRIIHVLCFSFGEIIDVHIIYKTILDPSHFRLTYSTYTFQFKLHVKLFKRY